MSHTEAREVEVEVDPESGRAVIEGKTVIPFQSFVTLILQKQVLKMMKKWGKDPVIVDSDLLAHLASSPQDSVQNRANLISVSMGVGAVAGVFISAVLFLVLMELQFMPTRKDLLIVIGGIVALALLAVALMRSRNMKKGEKLTETIENLSALLSK